MSAVVDTSALIALDHLLGLLPMLFGEVYVPQAVLCLELAMREGLPLATEDVGLRAAAGRVGVALSQYRGLVLRAPPES